MIRLYRIFADVIYPVPVDTNQAQGFSHCLMWILSIYLQLQNEWISAPVVYFCTSIKFRGDGLEQEWWELKHNILTCSIYDGSTRPRMQLESALH